MPASATAPDTQSPPLGPNLLTHIEKHQFELVSVLPLLLTPHLKLTCPCEIVHSPVVSQQPMWQILYPCCTAQTALQPEAFGVSVPPLCHILLLLLLLLLRGTRLNELQHEQKLQHLLYCFRQLQRRQETGAQCHPLNQRVRVKQQQERQRGGASDGEWQLLQA